MRLPHSQASLHSVLTHHADVACVFVSAVLCACQVATDIAARGLDIPDVQLVLQNGLPQNKEFYVHRAGRTARAGKAGKCVLLYGAKERQEVGALGRELGVSFQFQAPPTVNVSTLECTHATATLYQMHFCASGVLLYGVVARGKRSLLSMTATASHSSARLSSSDTKRNSQSTPHSASYGCLPVAHLSSRMCIVCPWLHQGETYSAVDGEPGYMTFLSQAAPNSIAPTRDDVVSYMESIVGASVQPGTVERSREAVIIDVPAAQGKQLAEVTHHTHALHCTALHQHTSLLLLLNQTVRVMRTNKARWVRLSPLALERVGSIAMSTTINTTEHPHITAPQPASHRTRCIVSLLPPSRLSCRSACLCVSVLSTCPVAVAVAAVRCLCVC